MEGYETGGHEAAASNSQSKRAEPVDHSESDFLLIKSVSEIACRLTVDERGKSNHS